MSLGVGPPLQLRQFLVVDVELHRAAGTVDREHTVAAALAPFQDGAVGVALALAQVEDDLADRRAEDVLRERAGSRLIDHVAPPGITIPIGWGPIVRLRYRKGVANATSVGPAKSICPDRSRA